MTKSRGIQTPRRQWTNEEDRIIAEHYPHTPYKELCELLGCSRYQLYNRANVLNAKKTPVFLAGPHSGCIRKGQRRGTAFEFKPGITPWNKGKSIGSFGNSVHTQFKPGVRQAVARKLYKPIGTERISKDGYIERKINDDMPLQKRWRAVHIIEWEKLNGPLPKGFALVFIDGNKQNTDPSNLELVSRAELMKRNSFHRYPKEIALAVQLRGQITRQINKRRKSDEQ